MTQICDMLICILFSQIFKQRFVNHWLLTVGYNCIIDCLVTG